MKIIKIINQFFENPLIVSIVIFIAAAIFRIFYMDLIEFKYDEAWGLFMVEKFFNQPYLAQTITPSSIGINNFPLSLYFITLLSIPVRNPQYLTFTIALLNTIFVVFFYLFVRKFYGNLVGIFSAFIIASSPYNILFSRKIWSPDFIFFFLVPLYYFIHKLILDKEKKAILPIFILIPLIIQMHLSGIYLLITTVSIFLILKIKISLKNAIKGFAIGFIPAIPYFLHEIGSNPFASLYKNGPPKSFFDLNNFILPFQTVNGYLMKRQLGTDMSLFLNSFPIIKFLDLVFILEFIIPLIGIFYILKYKKNYIFLILYPLITSLLNFLIRSDTRIYEYHYLIISPLIALIYGLSFYFILNLVKNNLYKLTIVILFISFVAINIIFEFYFYQFLSSKKIISEPYGPIFPVTKDFVESQTQQYMLLPYYGELKSYAYVFANPIAINPKLGEYFMQKNELQLAIEEFKKGITANEKFKFKQNIIYSRYNLIYLDILIGRLDEAKKELGVFYQEDSKAAEELKVLYDKAIMKNSSPINK